MIRNTFNLGNSGSSFENKSNYPYQMEVLGNGGITQWKCLVSNAAVAKVFNRQAKLWEVKEKKENKRSLKRIIQTDRREKDTYTKHKPVVSP